MLTLIDTHAHLNFEEFNQDREGVIERASSVGIEKIINIGTDLATSICSIELSKQFESIYAVVGCHPHESVEFLKDKDNWTKISELLEQDKVVGVGEVGLDYYRNISDQKSQRDCFVGFVRIANKINKPLVIHNREAFNDVVDVLAQEAADTLTGVFHCFSGDTSMVKKVMDLNFYVSVGGTLTYPKNELLRELIKYIPRDRILLETDCPYLAPQKFRGKRNEPAYVRLVFDALAESSRTEPDVLAKRLRKNVSDLFGI